MQHWLPGLYGCASHECMGSTDLPEGISADGESLAGKTWEDALHTAEEKVKDQAGTSVALTIEDKKAETTAGELGFHWSNQDEAEKELKSYVGGSLIRQYMNKKDLEKAPVDVSIKTAADPDKIREDFVDTIATEYWHSLRMRLSAEKTAHL